jgi:hypothetical protein
MGSTASRTKETAQSWQQPVCDECWGGLKLKTGREAPFLFPASCCFCNISVAEGKAYMIRVNPGSVPYPTLLKTDGH